MRGQGRGVSGAALSETVKKSILNFRENINDSDVFSHNDTKHPHQFQPQSPHREPCASCSILVPPSATAQPASNRSIDNNVMSCDSNKRVELRVTSYELRDCVSPEYEYIYVYCGRRVKSNPLSKSIYLCKHQSINRRFNNTSVPHPIPSHPIPSHPIHPSHPKPLPPHSTNPSVSQSIERSP